MTIKNIPNRNFFAIKKDKLISVLLDINNNKNLNENYTLDKYIYINSIFTKESNSSNYIKVAGFFIIKYYDEFLCIEKQKDLLSLGILINYSKFLGTSGIPIESLAYRSLEYYIEDISIKEINYKTILYNNKKDIDSIIIVYEVNINYLPEYFNKLKNPVFLDIKNKKNESLTKISKKIKNLYGNEMD